MFENKKLELTKDEMLLYLNEINERLASEGKHGEIMLVGGAALTLVFNARNSTRDIDAIFHPIDDMRKIISSVAEKYDLEQNWLNDLVRTFVTEKIEFEPYMEYSNLTVSSANAESLLAMKLTSARVNTTNDMDDSIFLMKHLNIKTEKELFDILDRHVDPFLRKVNVKHFTTEAFKKYIAEEKRKSN